MVKVSCFTHAGFSEGMRMMSSLRELGGKANTVRENVRGNFFVVDDELQAHINAINDYILKRLEE